MLYQSKNPHGGDIYGGNVVLDFSANTNPFGTPQGVLDAIAGSLPNLHRYPDPYCRELVRAIGTFEGVQGEMILCGNGAADLIYAFCRAVRPHRAAEMAPTFSEYSLGLRGNCEVLRYTLRQENDFRLDEGFLTFLRTEKPEAVFLCNPNNPTGALLEPALLQKILAYCHETGTRLFLDECFLDLTDDGISAKEHLAACPELLILKAFTKSYGMAGVRLGYCLSGDPELLSRMARESQPWNVSTPAQAAGIAALRERDFLLKTRELIGIERIWLRDRLQELGFWVCPSRVNFILFQGPRELHRKLMERGIAIRSCDNYPGLGPGWFRIAVRTHRENRTLIDAIGAVTERK